MDRPVDGITYRLNDGGTATVIAKTSGKYSGDIIIPSNVTYGQETYTVTGIGEKAFYRCTGLKSITIPDSVESIGASAFEGCSSLTSITIPSGVTSIANSTFHGCSGLTSIKIPDKVTSIEASAFSSCSGLTSIKIPDKVTEIGNNAFAGCGGLTSIKIPSGVESIQNLTFLGCNGLTNITIPAGVTSIRAGAFKDCHYLEKVIFEADSKLTCIESVGRNGISGAFQACIALTSITIPDGVTSIGAQTFYQCWKLESITIPDGVTSIGLSAFNECKALTNITIPNSVTSIGNSAFNDCEKLTSIAIPTSVTKIGTDAFKNCDSTLTALIYGTNAQGNTTLADKFPNHIFLATEPEIDYIIDKSAKLKEISNEKATDNSGNKLTVKYSKDGENWHTKPIFTGLEPRTEYTFEVGLFGNSNDKQPKAVYKLAPVKTLDAINIELKKITQNSVTLETLADLGSEITAKYCIKKDGTWQPGSGPEFTGLEPNTPYSFGVGLFKNSSDDQLITVYELGSVKTLAANMTLEAEDITQNSITLKPLESLGSGIIAKYCIKQDGNVEDWQTNPKFEGLTSGTTYTFKAKYFVGNKGITEAIEANIKTLTPYTPPAKPTIDIAGKEGGTVIYDRIKHTVTITPNDNYLVKEITLNGTTVPVTDGAMVLENIYGWSRISVTFEPKPELAFEPDKYISELKFKANSSKTSKGNIRIKVNSITDDNGNKIDLTELKDKGYTVKFKYYRSTKKASKYTAKVEKDADINSYINTSGKKGIKYYYKVRVMVYDADGNLVAKSDLKQCSYAARIWSK